MGLEVRLLSKLDRILPDFTKFSKMATGLAIQRSRAEQRLRNVSTAMDRASGYTLGNINATPAAVTLRRGRDHSLGGTGTGSTLGRTPSLRESSLTRGGRGARDTDRHSMMLPVNTETAKYHRQKDLQDIHDNFMKSYKTTTKKINDDGAIEGEERRSKAYQKIMSNAAPSYMDEQQAKRQTVSEMFMDTNKFSTKTLSAINNLEGAVIRKKQDYNWRKEMEDYEKRSEFERDVRSRNVIALNRDTEENSVAVSSRKRQTDTAREIQIDKAPKQDHVAAATTIKNNNNVDRPNKAVESWRKSRENARPQTVAELQPEIEKKSWRERLAEREKEEEERKAKAAAQAPQPSPKVTVPPQEIRPRAVPAAPEASIQPKAEAPKQQQQKQIQQQQQPADGQPAVKLSVRAQARAKARAKAAAEAAA